MAGIQKEKIDLFFQKISEKCPAVIGTIYVTGGAALILYGIPLMTVGIDFEIPEGLSEEKIMAVSKEMGIPVQFGTDIERWGMTALAGYREQSKPYKSFGGLTVKIVDPLNLIAPKLSRFLDRDIEDVKVLIENFKISRHQLLEHLKQVYARSPISTEKGLFRNQVAQFLKDYQQELWNRQESLPPWLTVLM